MTDLVKRLREGWVRDAGGCDVHQHSELELEAADRIEELEGVNKKQITEIHKLVRLLDDQLGTPCEQIRHQQEKEELEDIVEGLLNFDISRAAPYRLRAKRLLWGDSDD